MPPEAAARRRRRSAFGGAATNAGDGIEAGAQAGRRPNGRQDPGDDLQLLEVLQLGARSRPGR